ncbi:DNA starvation/stationary phase protection protein [Microcoleus sp. FACHB-1515]|uniref:Dps family protein n=1 Tax=Cyanophyceae TaxID=3028117 RepID=UPI0016866337|nr:Dps family protein [Microcoleus sp. FACHB-1515]MBD2089756.1 DNA starvation/stationary phase protection protein [Microcoleus sp. FACHB-1515]
MRRVNIGLSDEQREGVCKLLNENLANSYLLQIKTKKYHWDVTGPQFQSVHTLLEEQYQALSQNIDAIAERTRALGFFPLGTAREFVEVGSLKEHPGDIPMATEMIQRLQSDHEHIIRTLRQHIDTCSDDFHDEGTADFLTGLMEAHEEMAWMLRSFVDGEPIETVHSNPYEESKTPVGSTTNSK